MKAYVLFLLLAFGTSQKAEDKRSQMMDWQRRSGQNFLIKLNEKDFMSYVRGPKDYHVVVMFTAVNAERGCSICAEAGDEFKTLSNSMRYTGAAGDFGKLFFVSVDYDEHGGADIFQQMKLTSAPAFYMFPSSGKVKKEDKFEVQKKGYQAETLATWIQDRTQIQIRVYRPPNYSNVGFILLITCSIAAIMYMKWSRVNNLLNRETISWVLITAVLAFISGQMWNSIRGPQYLMRARGGGIGFVYPSSQHQLIAETHIVLLLYAMCTSGVIFLAKGGKKQEEGGKRRFYVLAGATLLAVGYGLILNIFKRKYQGYPYSFFLG